MLRILRKHASSWIIKILLGIIVVVFIFFGFGSFSSKKANMVASVNGKIITPEQYRRAYNNLIDQYRYNFGGNLSNEMIKMLQLDKKALDLLIDQRVLLNESKHLKIIISNDELENALKKITAFQEAGKFSNRIYLKLLSRSRITPEKFEASQREMMVIEKLKSFVTGGVKTSEKEAKEWFNWDESMVNIDIVAFKPDKYDDIKPTNEEIQAFFEENKNRYKTEPKINVRYLHFDPSAYISKVKISEETIKEYFMENADKYIKPKTVEARHILLKVNSDAGQVIADDKKKKALDILKLAKEGEDFADLAKKYSEGPSKDKGGYLGDFPRTAMVKPFADKAFSMKAGEISEPVRTEFGWHIIKVEKVNEGSARKLDEVKDSIGKKLTDEKAKILASEEAESVFDISIEGDDLVKAAKEYGLELKTTGFFSKKEPYKGVKDANVFITTAFNLPLMEVSEVQSFSDGHYILQVLEKAPETIPELKDVKFDVTADLKKEQQEEKAAEDAGNFLKAVKESGSLKEESKKLNLEIISTGFFKRNDPIPKIGSDIQINKTVFMLSEKTRLAGDVVKGTGGYYVIEFKERKTPLTKDFDKEKTKIIENLQEQKKMKLYNSWLTQLKDKSEISINDDFWGR